MVLQVMKWDIHPGKRGAFIQWVKVGVEKALSVPGVVEFRAYRSFIGDKQIVSTFEFEDETTWLKWRSNAEVNKVLEELYAVALNVSIEVWGASPVFPDPIRPGK